jgi:hypothetical protein
MITKVSFKKDACTVTSSSGFNTTTAAGIQEISRWFLKPIKDIYFTVNKLQK